MATPRARGGISLTTSPPIKRSPLVCFSSPQMMRRSVVLPQPDGPSSTMNSPSGTVREMPFTAGTSPHFLMISLVDTAAMESSRIPDASDRAKARPAFRLSSPSSPLLEDGLTLSRCPLDRLFGAQLTCRRLRHHVGDDEGVVDFVHRGRSRSRIARNSGPLVRVLQDRQLVARGRCRIVRQNRHR